MGVAPFLRKIDDAKSSRVQIHRLALERIRPSQIERILCNKLVGGSSSSPKKTLKDRWGLASERDVATAARVVYEKTCGQPRTMAQLFAKCLSYDELVYADAFGPDDTEWEPVLRLMPVWKAQLTKWLPAIVRGDRVDLSEPVERPAHTELAGKAVSFATVMYHCHLGWDDTVTRARIYVLPRVLLAVANIVASVPMYIRTVGSLLGHRVPVPQTTAMALQWVCLKRFQELFADPMRRSYCFFGGDTVFGRYPGVAFPDTVVDLPTITTTCTKLKYSASMTSSMVHPQQWPQLMHEIDTMLHKSLTGSVCLKPRTHASASADVVFIQRVHGGNSSRTLTVGLSVRVAAFSVDDVCGQFNCMFENLDEATSKNFGDQTNVLIVCCMGTTNSYDGLQGESKNYRYCSVGVDRSTYPHIHEVLLLDLTTRHTRSAFFGLDGQSDSIGLLDILDHLIFQTERERGQQGLGG